MKAGGGEDVQNKQGSFCAEEVSQVTTTLVIYLDQLSDPS
jgi:hypothetical protein